MKFLHPMVPVIVYVGIVILMAMTLAVLSPATR